MLGASPKEYTAKEIVLATDNFSCQLRSVGIWGDVYKGYIKNDPVSVKFLSSRVKSLKDFDFKDAVMCLNLIRHPHLVSMRGFCSELECVVYEYIEETFSVSEVVKKNLLWHDRIRIASDIFSALSYIKSARKGHMFPDYLRPSNVLIDRNNIAKVNFVMKICDRDGEYPGFVWDVKTFGFLILNLLTGYPANIFSYCYLRVRCWVDLTDDLDKTAGEWPMDLAERLMKLCRRCVDCSPTDDFRNKYFMVIIEKEIKEIREKADDIVRGHAGSTSDVATTSERRVRRDQKSYTIPRHFYWPIYMEVIKDPYVAADGFSYEGESIQTWLNAGNDTSPMTNMKLNNRTLTPNGTLKLVIKEWHSERSIPYP